MKVLVIFWIILILSVSLVSAEDFDYYKITFSYELDVLEISNVEIISSSYPIAFYEEEIEGSNQYNLQIFDKDDSGLASSFFHFSRFFSYSIVNETGDDVIGGEVIELDSSFFDVYIPYYEDAEYIIVYDGDGNEIIRVDMDGNIMGEPSSTISDSGSPGRGGGTYIPLYWIKTYIVDEDDFNKGYSKGLAKRHRFKTEINNKTHYVGVVEVKETSAVINIALLSQNISFNIGDEKDYDLNDDGEYDLSVILNSIENNKVDVSIKRFEEVVEEVKREDIEERRETPKSENLIYKNKILVSLVFTIVIVLVIVLIWKPFKVVKSKKIKKSKQTK